MFSMSQIISTKLKNIGYINSYYFIRKIENTGLCNFCNYSTRNVLTCYLPRCCDIIKNQADYRSNRIGKEFAITKLSINNFCSKIEVENADVFGHLDYTTCRNVEMTQKEKEDEEYEQNNFKVARWAKPSSGQYVKMINNRIKKGDLISALKVFQLIKYNRDKPNMYMFNILIRAFAVQGDVKECFKLYNKMKKYGFKPNDATYNSLFNSCAESKNEKLAINLLEKLRKKLYEQNYVLNDIHYNTLIKVYAWHKRIYEAFEIVDIMRDKHIPITENTFDCLLHAAISDKEAGLRHALTIWCFMRIKKIKPSLITYNLFIRAIKETKFGDLKANDVLIPTEENTKIYISDNKKPDLLAFPPILSTLSIPISIAETNSKTEQDVTNKKSFTITLSPDMKLNEIFIHNRLLLFGGYKSILNRMVNDNVTPDIKTITMLMELLPNSVTAENDIIKYAKSNKIMLDIDFFNMVIRKRSLRKDYKSAKQVLDLMQLNNLEPNIMTFGVLALGCTIVTDAWKLIQVMEHIGYMPNHVIIGTFISNGCIMKNIDYIMKMMKYSIDNGIKLHQREWEKLSNFKESLSKITLSKKKFRSKSLSKSKIEEFYAEYTKWEKLWIK